MRYPSLVCQIMGEKLPQTSGAGKPGRKLPPANKLFQCAVLYFQSNWPVHQIAATYKVDRTTIYRWVKAALDGEDSLEVMQMAKRSQRRFKLPSRKSAL